MWPEGARDITKTTKRPLTAGSLFRNSMTALIKHLTSKDPFYVRCIKPNEVKSPAIFDEERVKHQVMYLGLVENVRVRRAGFVYRQRYDIFLKRYKMISQFTWPNFKGGSDKEGVKVIMDEHGFSNDVKYGRTKIFIRSPRTLFQLENARNELIPGIVTLLQKQWRGYLCRVQYKRMKAAVYIMAYYRNYKLRTYVEQLSRKFKNARSMRDYGKSVQWPAPPLAVRSVVRTLRQAYARWRAWMILSKVPREEWYQLRLKLNAASALRSKRRFWGQTRKWEGNYLAQGGENANNFMYTTTINNLKNTEHFQTVLFSSFIKKFNKYNKSSDRAILVTDHSIYKIDRQKFKNLKRGIPIQEVFIICFCDCNFFSNTLPLQLRGISVTMGQDQLVVIHTNFNNDFIFTLQNNSRQDFVGELVGILCTRFFQYVLRS